MTGDPTLTVRAYQSPLDAYATHSVFRPAILCTASRDYDSAQVQAWAGPEDIDLGRWDERRAAVRTFVAVVSGQVVGFTDLHPDGLVDMLFVHPDFSRRGVAGLLVETVQREAVDSGLTALQTYASRTAKPVFEHLGFRVVAARPDNMVGGQVVPNYEMRCDLPTNRQ